MAELLPLMVGGVARQTCYCVNFLLWIGKRRLIRNGSEGDLLI